MNTEKLNHYRERLRKEGAGVMKTAASVEEAARGGTGGQTSGNLSNAPMHLGDMGTELYLQELNATLLENETYLRDEYLAALDRIENGTFGRCERCGQDIPEKRLDVLPYVRHCTSCAEKLQAGAEVNLNTGRVGPGPDTLNPHDDGPEERRAPPGQNRKAKRSASPDPGDRHAAGTPGGGSAVGGLAGTNLGSGDPNDADLESAMGSSTYDVNIEEGGGNTEAYSGPSGGAVGGTPAGKRSVGGKTGGGIAPRPGPGDDPMGS